MQTEQGVAFDNYGMALFDKGLYEEAINAFLRAI